MATVEISHNTTPPHLLFYTQTGSFLNPQITQNVGAPIRHVSMNQPNTLIFTKKFRLPSPAANIIQTLNMAWGFQSAGASVHLFPGLSQTTPSHLLQNLETEYRLDKNTRPHVTFLPARNKGIYGALFRFCIFKKWLTHPDALFFSRDVKETLFLLDLRRLFQRQQKIVYEMHDSVFLEHREYGQKDADAYKKWEKRILSDVDGIVYTGTYLKKKIEELFPVSTPSIVAVPGFNKQIFSPLPLELPTTSITLGYFGSLHPGKGVSLLIEAFKKLPQNYRLRIIGGNPRKEYLALQARVQKEINEPERVQFIGQLPPDKVRNHLAGCHMIVIPFVSEVEFLSPIKLYEALGMELPVVATPVPAIQSAAATLPNVIISAGSSPHEFAGAIRSLGDHPETIRKIHAKTRAQNTRYDWEDRASQVYAFACAL
ncbi:glycosyltransferase family 4 protein [Desulfoplanes sp. PS50]